MFFEALRASVALATFAGVAVVDCFTSLALALPTRGAGTADSRIVCEAASCAACCTTCAGRPRYCVSRPPMSFFAAAGTGVASLNCDSAAAAPGSTHWSTRLCRDTRSRYLSMSLVNAMAAVGSLANLAETLSSAFLTGFLCCFAFLTCFLTPFLLISCSPQSFADELAPAHELRVRFCRRSSAVLSVLCDFSSSSSVLSSTIWDLSSIFLDFASSFFNLELSLTIPCKAVTRPSLSASASFCCFVRFAASAQDRFNSF
mmetsp:Transcript_150672/g.280947  ORF Transcript_150672/g.280947 Transcript_150672/m.280947 type:complete len:259 (-) Transcript_150672:468-1244(-)